MPDTTGNDPNLAKFLGQRVDLFDADQKAYTRVHFFGTTTDGGPAGGNFTLTYDDGSDPDDRRPLHRLVPDPEHAARHTAIGPLSGRWTAQRLGHRALLASSTCPPTIDAGKSSWRSRCRRRPPAGGANTQSYLMSLTLEQPDGAFEMTDLSGSLQFPDDDIAPVTTHELEPGEPDGADGWYRSPGW